MPRSSTQLQEIDFSFDQLSNRRKFLTALAASAGALALSACGGGDASSDSATDAVANAARNKKNGSGSSSGSGTTTGTGVVVAAATFGVKANGTSDDTAAMQAAINGTVGNILLISGQVRVTAAGLTLLTNSHLRFATGASIKLLAHNTASYQILRIWDVKNVTIESPYLDGSKELNSAVNNPNDGGAGMGISIAGATTVNITSPTTINCWGDGIYITNSYNTLANITSGVTVTNHLANGCRRQGVTITSGSNITFQNPIWENIGGTLPSAGLDIEPNNNLAVLQNINIISPTTTNNRYGILVYLGELPGPAAKVVSINITNHHDTAASDCAFEVNGLALNGYSVTGLISSSSPTFTKSAVGYALNDWDKAGPTVQVTKITTVR